jgi:hypothetical protein
MYREIIDRLISYPQRGQIKIDFDVKQKVFCLSIPIFSSRSLPESVKSFVDARKSYTFKPHATSYRMEGGNVLLVQEVPFTGGFQDTLRGHVDQFWQVSKHCHRMVAEIAIEEKYKDALRLDSHFEE